jgi:glycosyltransferase involved in cell wall biosynthesis
VGDAGICVPPGRPDLLADALDAVVQDHTAVRRRAVERGRVLARTHSWDVIADRMIERIARDS